MGRAFGSRPAQPTAASAAAATASERKARERERNGLPTAFAVTPAPGSSERSVPLIRSAMLIRDSAIRGPLIGLVDRIR
ncbi:hypothetical protein Arub01_01060 [Actinomadura rubrobrunea]|uniref:Uncharacterized protein n=1 Tax=Actinomadura rubrobrunea TaxID=115335 RepID=A0A9W6UU41_9ACTN|nr:hypothetical protein Arub01_01060 [Actinomadura rubrobrunea]